MAKYTKSQPKNVSMFSKEWVERQCGFVPKETKDHPMPDTLENRDRGSVYSDGNFYTGD